MDFVKKFAQEQLEEQMGGGEQKQHGEGNYNQNQNQNQGQGQGQGYGNQQYGNQQPGYGGGNNDSQGGLGGLLNSFTGGQQQGQQQQSYGGQQQQSFGGGQSGGFGVTGGAEYNAPHGSGGASSYGVPGGFGIPNINQNEAIQAANQHAGNGNENASLFSQAFSFIQGMNKDDKDVDEDDVQRKHEAAYGLGQSGSMSANAIGAAAAMQAIKQFTSGNSPAAGGSTQKGGNDMVSKIIGMAVSEAAKLFDKSGGAASGTKEDAVTSAGQTVMKLLIKNQVSGMMGGGQSGGLGSLMSMASKYM